MNYRHSYHAGNFADVLKHAVLCWTVKYLQQKEAPLSLIDTHAGRGVYDLAGPDSDKTSEARQGVLRLLNLSGIPTVLEPYLDCVRLNSERRYPGSPALLQALARAQDRVTLCELHPEELAELRANIRECRNVSIFAGDGYRKLRSLIPPPEKRGLVLIDPPFEEPDELSRLTRDFIAAHRKWPTGVYLLWFPLKDRALFERFRAELQTSLIPKITLVLLDVDRAEGLSATGLVLVNPPYTFEDEWRPVLAWMINALAQGPDPSFTLERIG